MNRILLDTHVLLWWLVGSPSLGRKTVLLLSDPANILYISPFSLLELEIKFRSRNLQRMDLGAIYGGIQKGGILELPYDLRAAEAFSSLPSLGWKDPFDAAIMAQAYSRDLVLATADRHILTLQWGGLQRIDSAK